MPKKWLGVSQAKYLLTPWFSLEEGREISPECNVNHSSQIASASSIVPAAGFGKRKKVNWLFLNIYQFWWLFLTRWNHTGNNSVTFCTGQGPVGTRNLPRTDIVSFSCLHCRHYVKKYERKLTLNFENKILSAITGSFHPLSRHTIAKVEFKYSRKSRNNILSPKHDNPSLSGKQSLICCYQSFRKPPAKSRQTMVHQAEKCCLIQKMSCFPSSLPRVPCWSSSGHSPHWFVFVG